MIKKRKKRVIYSIGQKEFNTFKEMKSYIWYNSHTDKETQGFELINDIVQKHYIFIKKEKVQPIVSVAPFYIHKILKERVFYLFLLQSLLISSRVLPFVSGTQRQTKKAAATQMMPYKLYANIGLKSYSAGNVEDMI